MSNSAKFNDNYEAYLLAQKQKRSDTGSQRLQDLELTNKTKSTDFSNAGPCNTRQQN